ncbi:MAG: cyclic nucleotide-binding domain-containing protein [Cruoricaptor ignavus]|nr:cyclic nucleotide-binding domain-containing protein [Cruoricaptor ignavus]
MPEKFQPLIEYFENITPLSESEKRLVTELFVFKSYKRKAFVLCEGEVCQQFNFIVKGCMRLYLTDEKADTHILQFAAENWIMTDAVSFREQTPSRLNIDTLEATELLYITPENSLRKSSEIQLYYP